MAIPYQNPEEEALDVLRSDNLGGIEYRIGLAANRTGLGLDAIRDLVLRTGQMSQDQWDRSGPGIALSQAEADGGGLGGFLGDAGKVALGSVGFGVGGATGAALATGNNPQQGAMLDLAGLAAGTGVGASGLLDAGALGAGAGASGAEAALGSAAVPSGGIGAATGASGAGAAMAESTLPALAAGAGGASALPDTGAENLFAQESVPGVNTGSILGTGALATGGVAGANAAANSFSGSGGGDSGGMGGSATSGGVGGSWLTDNNDWLKMLAAGAPGLLGAFGAYNQSKDYKDLANQYAAMGAPYRGKLAELYGDPTAFLNSPEVRQPIQQGTDMLAHSLSTKGNPAGSGNALQELQNYASTQLFSRLGQEKDRLAGFGGLAQYNAAAPAAQSNQINAQKGIYDAVGAGFADVFNPPKRYSLQDLLGR